MGGAFMKDLLPVAVALLIVCCVSGYLFISANMDILPVIAIEVIFFAAMMVFAAYFFKKKKK